jgi:dethiobiotin synthetase
MSAVFVTATGTDVGKTFVACALIRSLIARGVGVDAFKPVLSGYDGPGGSDAALLLEALGRPLSDIDAMSPLRFAAPLAPPSAALAEGRRLDLADLERRCREKVAETPGLLLIEGAGGLMSPLADGATNLDLITALDAPVILVAGSYLGSVSHTLTALEAARARGVKVLAVVVSESPGAAPDISEMTFALAHFARGLPVLTAPRGRPWNAAELADILT